jgi:hypothetical protein
MTLLTTSVNWEHTWEWGAKQDCSISRIGIVCAFEGLMKKRFSCLV